MSKVLTITLPAFIMLNEDVLSEVWKWLLTIDGDRKL
jgi:hypothetical protein